MALFLNKTQVPCVSTFLITARLLSHGANSGYILVSADSSMTMVVTRTTDFLFTTTGGGMPQSTNRTKWPVHGGGVSIQPGWFPGHSFAMFYINIGITEPGNLAPRNMSHPAVPPFQLVGPSNFEYPGQFCIPQVGMPKDLDLQVGANITIQAIEQAQHGAALYNCVDVTLTEPEKVEQITKDNCYNSSDLAFNLVYATTSLTGAAPTTVSMPSTAALALFAAAVISAIGGSVV